MAMHEDIERIIFSADDIRLKVKEIGQKITADYRDVSEEIFCVGILKGAVVFFADLVRNIDVPVSFDFMIASSYGSGTSSSGAVKILKDLDFDIADKHLILIEDIVDTGTTLSFLTRYFQTRHAKSIKICSLLSKPSRRKVDIKVDYFGYEVPNEFLVGYGLDYAGKYRNLPYIGVLKREIYA